MFYFTHGLLPPTLSSQGTVPGFVFSCLLKRHKDTEPWGEILSLRVLYLSAGFNSPHVFFEKGESEDVS